MSKMLNIKESVVPFLVCKSVLVRLENCSGLMYYKMCLKGKGLQYSGFLFLHPREHTCYSLF